MEGFVSGETTSLFVADKKTFLISSAFVSVFMPAIWQIKAKQEFYSCLEPMDAVSPNISAETINSLSEHPSMLPKPNPT